MMMRILIADDHSMIRKGLKLHMQLTLGYTDIEEVATCNGLMKELVKNIQPECFEVQRHDVPVVPLAENALHRLGGAH